MAATIQAQKIAKILRTLGLAQRGSFRDFSVRTEGSGSSDSGFGDAVASLYSRKASELVYDNAEKIVAQGATVLRFTVDGRKHAIVSSAYPYRVQDTLVS